MNKLLVRFHNWRLRRRYPGKTVAWIDGKPYEVARCECRMTHHVTPVKRGGVYVFSLPEHG